MIFKSDDSKKILKYVKEKYGTELEFLWAKFPKNAILRHKDSPKWYGALLIIPKSKLGIKEKGDIEIMDLKCEPEMVSFLRDGKRFFPAYHMNKEHWITILLNGTIPIKEIYKLIDISFNITPK